MRIDKWLWAARFFKTRSLATVAVDGGKVKLNGSHIKPAKEIRPGDRLEIALGDLRWEITVRGLSAQRRPAPEARLLYEEDEASVSRRQARLEQLKLAPTPGADLRGRPTKRARRLIHRFSSE